MASEVRLASTLRYLAGSMVNDSDFDPELKLVAHTRTTLCFWYSALAPERPAGLWMHAMAVAITFFFVVVRMAVDCAFGILVRRWGVFLAASGGAHGPSFNPRRRGDASAQLLHRPAHWHRAAGGACASEIQPRVWAPSPNFGKNGEPVDFLDTMDHDAATDMDRCTRRDELKRSIENAGLKHPGFALQETA